MFALNYSNFSSQGGVEVGENFYRRSSISSDRTAADARRSVHTEGQIKCQSILDCQSEVMCCKFSADGSSLAAGLANGKIKIFNPESGVLLYSLSDSDVATAHLPCTGLEFKPYSSTDKTERQHLLVATYASGKVKVWHYSSNTCVHTIDEVRQSLCVAFNADGTHFVTGGGTPQLHVYDTESKQVLKTLEASDSRDIMNGHRQRVFAVQYHPVEEHTLVSGGWDDTVQFWDERVAHAVRSIYGPHICGGDALDIDPQHNHLLTGSWRSANVLQIWDFATGAKIKDVPQDALHKCMLYCAQWLGKDYIICGGTEQNMARIIDRGTLNTVAQIFDLEQGVYCTDYDRSSSLPRIAVGAATNLYVMKQEKKG